MNTNAFRIVRSLTEEKQAENHRTVTSRAGGKIGGPARAKLLSPEERREIAAKASRARWHRSA